ncbi:FAD-dependent oxidoreductase [Pantanalinema rosaneae CENA516]|uniref:FAD-dependent oxidoreductase n=1 Tax=Pantanalinema rosaneae TaxID=1620701 RepID=UPI003D6F9418
MKRVVIVGAGPSGVLLAHYLLRQGEQYQVALYDRRPDPRQTDFSTARTFPISLNDRGMDALKPIPSVAAEIDAVSVKMVGTVFHQTNGKRRETKRKQPLITLDRTRLVIVLLEQLAQLQPDPRLTIRFNCQCTELDLAAKVATFQTVHTESPETFTVEYDLLIGADGANSTVREQLVAAHQVEVEQKYVPNAYKSIVLPPPDPKLGIELEPNKIQTWRTSDGTLVMLLSQRDSSLSGVILFPYHRNPLSDRTTPEALLEFFQQRFAEVGQMMSVDDAAMILEHPVARVLTIRCNRYHYGDSVLIIGDAAHAVSPALGQGCNSALEDVVILDNLLREYGDDSGQAIAQFTERRLTDAHALTEISDYAFPTTTRLFIEFILREQLAKVLHPLFPKIFPPPLAELVFDSTVPYSQILNSYKDWIARVKRSNEQFFSQS